MENHGKSFVKGITWRIIGTLDTIFLSWIFTGQIGNALKLVERKSSQKLHYTTYMSGFG